MPPGTNIITDLPMEAETAFKRPETSCGARQPRFTKTYVNIASPKTAETAETEEAE